ncbi:MAG: hypothetical protein WEG36_16505 [Gemmatimonadota bacterium]
MTKEARNVHSRLLIAALLLCIAFLILESVIRIWDLYRLFPLVDLPSHVLSGMAACALGYWGALRAGAARPKIWAVAFSLAVAFGWEGTEAIQEWLWPDDLPWLRDYFIWDGVGDVAAALVGTLLSFPYLKILRRTFKTFKPMDV